MKVVRVVGTRTAEVVEAPMPIAAGDVALIKVVVTPMCTEWQAYREGNLTPWLGHEAAGIVVDAASSHRVRVGDRVVVMPAYGCGRCAECSGGEHIHCVNQRDVLSETGSETGTATYAQYMLKPDALLWPVPDDISLVHASLACCALGPTLTAFERLRVNAFDTLLVSGCGPVGLGAVVHAAVRGVRTIALELHPYRAALAKSLGAEAVIDPTAADAAERVLEFTGARGIDAAIETSAAPAAVPLIEKVMRAHGRVAIVGWGARVELREIVPRGLEVHGCWHWNHVQHGEVMRETIRRARSRLDSLVTHQFDIDSVAQAFELQLGGACGKLLLFPWGYADVA